MAGRRRQIRLTRGLGLVLGVVTGVALPAACSTPESPTVTRTLVREGGVLEASPGMDAEAMDAEGGASDAEATDAEATDAGLAPVVLGVTPIVSQADASASDQTLAELDMLAAGARARSLVVRLDDLLDASGAPSDAVFANLGATAALYRARGDSILFAIAVVDRTQDARPAALQASWSSPDLSSALNAVVDRAFATFGTELAYLSFGTDVDRFLALANDSDRAASTALFEAALVYAKAHPKRLASTRVAVTFSAPSLLGVPLPEVAALLHRSDAAIVTNYPLEASFQATSVSGAVTQLLDLAQTIASDEPGLPVVLQELGYPSSTMIGSSPNQQEKFYEALFGMLATQRDRFPFVDLYASNDADEAECEREALTFGAAQSLPLIAARCSLGLKDQEGVEKPAWAAVIDALSAFGRP